MLRTWLNRHARYWCPRTDKNSMTPMDADFFLRIQNLMSLFSLGNWLTWNSNADIWVQASNFITTSTLSVSITLGKDNSICHFLHVMLSLHGCELHRCHRCLGIHGGDNCRTVDTDVWVHPFIDEHPSWSLILVISFFVPVDWANSLLTMCGAMLFVVLWPGFHLWNCPSYLTSLTFKLNWSCIHLHSFGPGRR